jgi:hypothetical protein
MSEAEPTQKIDVAVGLAAQLEAEGRFVEAGAFTLDARKAREKLAAHQLAEPERYVLFLVEAAHLLPGCTGVAFTLDSGATRVRFDGVELRGNELQGCFDALFIDVAGLDPDVARRMRGRQCLALAINTALGLPDARVEMHSTIAGEGSVGVGLDAEARVQVDALGSTSSTSSLIVVIHHAAISYKQRDVLRQDARYATVPISVDGLGIRSGLADLCAAIEIRDAASRVVGRAGWCAAQTRQASARIVWVANGVVIESHPEPSLPIGVLVLLDASDLARDISHAKLQRDETFHRRIEAVAPSCEALSKPVPTLGPEYLGVQSYGSSVFFGLLAASFIVGGVYSMFDGSILIGACSVVNGLVFGFLARGFVQHVERYHRIRTCGQARLALIASSSGGSSSQAASNVRVDLLVERPSEESHVVSFDTRIESRDNTLEPGKRVYVRIDPNDPQQWIFDPGE